MSDILNATHIPIPEINAFESYDQILEAIPRTSNAIYLFAAGMPAKLLIADLLLENPNATYLDCGSSFDPIIRQTRTEQIPTQDFIHLYRPNYYALDQQTHPEKLFVLNHIHPTENIVFDLGCGTNKTLHDAIGCDIRDVTDIQCDISSPPFPPNSANVIISRHSLEHILNPFKTLKNWAEIIKTSGKIILVLPDHGCIDTIDHYYSKGEHLHAYTRESIQDLISLFPHLMITHQQTVLPLWSFGTVIHKLPSITILLPTLGREDQLEKCIESIEDLNYPADLLNIIVLDGEDTVPNKIKRALESEVIGDFVCYAANDMTFDPDCLKNAVYDSLKYNKHLVSFNEGPLLPDQGNICTHFIINKKLIPFLDNQEIFCTEFKHTGVDNYLWAQASKLNHAMYSEKSKITHNHFSKNSNPFDDVYKKGWEHVEADRILLTHKLKNL